MDTPGGSKQGSRANIPQVIEQPVATASVRRGTGVMTDIGNNSITARAEEIRRNTDEGMIWKETPSLALMVQPVLTCLVILFVCFVITSTGKQKLLGQSGERISSVTAEAETAAQAATKRGGKRHVKVPTQEVQAQAQAQVAKLADNLFLLPLLAGGCAALWLTVTFLRIKTTKYAASSQRLVVETGILNTINRPYEIHTLSNAIIVRPLLLRLFGASNLIIGNPRIALLGLRNAAYVRDILRTSGQLEAQRIDKIRWR